jgi:hypothetical protein
MHFLGHTILGDEIYGSAVQVRGGRMPEIASRHGGGMVGGGRGVGAGGERARERNSLETPSTRRVDARIAEGGGGGDWKGKGGRGSQMETGAEGLQRGKEAQERSPGGRGGGGVGGGGSERLCLHAWRLSFVHPTSAR